MVCLFLLAANLIYNPAFTLDDGLGGLAGWSVHNTWTWAKPDDWQLATPTLKSTGDGVAEIVFTGRESRLVRQNFITLAPGGRYRMAIDVRTSGLKPAKALLSAFDVAWRLNENVALPDDTKGKWVRVEREFTVPSDCAGEECSFAIQSSGREEPVRVEIRRPSLEPLNEIAEKKSEPVAEKYVRKRVQRIVPIEPTLFDVSTADGALAFYWPGVPAGGRAGLQLKASVDGKGEISAPLGKEGCARLRFGPLSAGDHEFKVRVTTADGTTLAENTYAGAARRPVVEGPSGRTLNNFVTELVNVPLRDGTFRFYRATDGWVWISFGERKDAARGYLDGASFAVVRPREGERRLETQRYVKRGWHRLEVRGATAGGTLRINAVKAIAGNVPPMRRGRCLENGAFNYTLPFMRRFDGFVFNTLTGSQGFALERAEDISGYFRERGVHLVGGGGGCGVFHPARQDQQELFERITSALWKARQDVLVDENPVELRGRWGTYVSRFCDWIYSENVWRMNAENPDSQVNTYYSDSNYGASFFDRESKTSELSAIVNSGRGTGMIIPEAYPPSLADASASGRWEVYFGRFLKSTTDLVPASRGKTLFWMAPYVTLGKWSSYSQPEADLKAHYSRLMYAFATKREFAEIGGLGFGALSSANDEVRRWGHRLVRHYCLEGGTDDLAVRYGYAWAPGFVKNPDFAEGLEGWTARPGEGGSIVAEKFPNYGRALQGRQNCPRGTGDGLAVFTSAAQPNRLEQRIAGLKPGNYYALEYTVADVAGIATKDGVKRAPVAFSATLEGGEAVRALHYRKMTNIKGHPQLAHERSVFKAKATEATLVFTDREENGAAAPLGTKQAINHIVFQPFYLESPNEIDEVIDFMTTVK